MTLHLYDMKDTAEHLGVDRYRLKKLRTTGRFPLPDARTGARLGWSPFRINRWAVEYMEWEAPADWDTQLDAERERLGSAGEGVTEDGTPRWWLIQPVRYLGLGELAEAAGFGLNALWTYYHNGNLPAPDIITGTVNGRAGWTPARARKAAAIAGWSFDLARLSDTSGLGKHL